MDAQTPETNDERSRATSPSWGLRVGAALICLMFGAATVQRLLAPPETLNDFMQEWTSARNHWDGLPVYLPLSESVPRHMRVRPERLLLEYNAHPPAAVLVSLPCGLFSYEQGLRCWNVLSLVALAAALLLLLGPWGVNWGATGWLVVGALVLSSNSFAQQMLQGQLNTLLLLLLAGAWVADRRGNSLLAGSLIGAAAAIKLVPAVLGLPFLARRDGRGVLGCALGAAVVNGAAAAVLGVDAFRDFFLEVVPHVGGRYQDYWSNVSFNGFWRKLLDGAGGHETPLAHLPQVAGVLTLLCSLGLIVWVGWRSRRGDSVDQRDRAFAASLVMMLLVSPIAWDHYFLMLLPTFCVLWEQAGRANERTPRVALVVLAVLLLFVRPTWIWDATIAGDGELAFVRGGVPSVAAPWQVLTVLAYQFYGLLALQWLAMRRSAEWGVRSGE